MPACAAVRRMRHGGRCCCRARAQSSTCEGHARKNSARTHTIPRAISLRHARHCPPTRRGIFSVAQASIEQLTGGAAGYIYAAVYLFARIERLTRPFHDGISLPSGPPGLGRSRPWPAGLGPLPPQLAEEAVRVGNKRGLQWWWRRRCWCERCPTRPSLDQTDPGPAAEEATAEPPASPVPVPSLAGPGPSRPRLGRRALALQPQPPSVEEGVRVGSGRGGAASARSSRTARRDQERVQRDFVGQVRVPLWTQVWVPPKPSP